MRNLLHGALGEAREIVGGVVGELRQENVFSEDEVLACYMGHRDDPLAKMNFVQELTGLEGEALAQRTIDYEREMEGLLKNRSGDRSRTAGRS